MGDFVFFTTIKTLKGQSSSCLQIELLYYLEIIQPYVLELFLRVSELI